MRTKAKTFDCVEMKQECQRKLREEYEARKGEFDSFADFISKTADKSPFVREMRSRFGTVRGRAVAAGKRSKRR